MQIQHRRFSLDNCALVFRDRDTSDSRIVSLELFLGCTLARHSCLVQCPSTISKKKKETLCASAIKCLFWERKCHLFVTPVLFASLQTVNKELTYCVKMWVEFSNMSVNPLQPSAFEEELKSLTWATMSP